MIIVSKTFVFACQSQKHLQYKVWHFKKGLV